MPGEWTEERDAALMRWLDQAQNGDPVGPLASVGDLRDLRAAYLAAVQSRDHARTEMARLGDASEAEVERLRALFAEPSGDDQIRLGRIVARFYQGPPPVNGGSWMLAVVRALLAELRARAGGTDAG